MSEPNDPDEARDTLLEFPCVFPIKAFGRKDGVFEQRVFELIKTHVPELEKSDLSYRDSRGGKYIAVTVRITARSQEQLDAIYGDLTDCGAVLMSL